MSAHPPHVLANTADVSALRAALPAFGWPASRSVEVRVASMDDGVRRRWERRLSLWLSACGCQTGGLLALGALVWRVHAMLGEPLTLRGMATHAGWVLSAAVAGKVIGLLVARVLLLRDLRRLAREMVAS